MLELVRILPGPITTQAVINPGPIRRKIPKRDEPEFNFAVRA